MAGRYLIRFDDLCPTMNWRMWERVEALLQAHEIRPILAVVPDNRDPELQVDAVAADFWERVQTWQARGWNIALHGYQHKFSGLDEGHNITIRERSEFVGFSVGQQRAKLSAALQFLREKKIEPQLWAAPWHSFDAATLQVLRELQLNIISDGMFLWPQHDRSGTIWIPQQLDDFRRLPFGVFTVCFHVNEWSETTFRLFEKNLTAYRAQIVTLEEILLQYQRRRAWVSGLAQHRIGTYLLHCKQSLRLRSRVHGAKKITAI